MDLNNSTVKHVKYEVPTLPEGTPDPLRAIYVTKGDTTYVVPVSEDNSDYQEILAWVAEGNTIEPADE